MRIQEFDYSVDLLQSVLWQYNEATNLLSLLNQKQDWYNINQTQFWTDWYNQVFRLASPTLSLFGASVWSIILNVPLFVPLEPEPIDKHIWGFNEYDPSFPTLINGYFNFENGNFSTKGQNGPELKLGEQQFLLRLRYFDLTTRGDITDINYFLDYLCRTSDIDYEGTIYALDGLDMTMTYVFTKPFSPALLEALLRNDILPRPAAVGLRAIVYVETTFGFNEYDPSFPTLINGYQNFENGNFNSGVFV